MKIVVTFRELRNVFKAESEAFHRKLENCLTPSIFTRAFAIPRHEPKYEQTGRSILAPLGGELSNA